METIIRHPFFQYLTYLHAKMFFPIWLLIICQEDKASFEQKVKYDLNMWIERSSPKQIGFSYTHPMMLYPTLSLDELNKGMSWRSHMTWFERLINRKLHKTEQIYV